MFFLNLWYLPGWIFHIKPVRLISTWSMGNDDPPILGKSADGESAGHGAECALHKPSVVLLPPDSAAHTASNGNAVEANHHRLRRCISLRNQQKDGYVYCIPGGEESLLILFMKVELILPVLFHILGGLLNGFIESRVVHLGNGCAWEWWRI